MHKIAYALLLSAFATAYAQAESWYGSAKFNNARQNLSSSLLTSPRVTERVDAPDSSKSFVASSPLAIALTMAGDWKGIHAAEQLDIQILLGPL